MNRIVIGIRVGGIYKLNVRSVPHQALTSSGMTTEDLWHQKFGHINFKDLLLLQKKGMVTILPNLKNSHVDYETCALGKMHRDEFPVNVNRKQRDILELVHTDLCGPMHSRYLRGAYDLLLFFNESTRFMWVYFLSKKSHVF